MSERSQELVQHRVADVSPKYYDESSEKPSEVTTSAYKWTEVGMIPKNWDLRTLADFYSFSNGINADKSSYGYGVPFINVLEPITYSHIRQTDIPGKVSVSARRAKDASVVYGDIAFNRTSETQEEIGLAAVYMGATSVVFGGFVIRARPKKALLGKR